MEPSAEVEVVEDSNGLDRCLSSEDEKVVECVDVSGESDDVDIGVPRARGTDDISLLKH